MASSNGEDDEDRRRRGAYKRMGIRKNKE